MPFARARYRRSKDERMRNQRRLLGLSSTIFFLVPCELLANTFLAYGQACTGADRVGEDSRYRHDAVKYVSELHTDIGEILWSSRHQLHQCVKRPGDLQPIAREANFSDLILVVVVGERVAEDLPKVDEIDGRISFGLLGEPDRFDGAASISC